MMREEEFYKSDMADVALIDLDGFSNPLRRSIIMEEMATACRETGFFQVVNHGIPEPILDGAISSASDFFDLPSLDKAKFLSSDVHSPVRYNTSVKEGPKKARYWRIFLKQYAHPLHKWVGLWPDTPPDYRQKMGVYAEAIQKLAVEIMGAITESLGLGPSYLTRKLEDGMQVMTVNCYPPRQKTGITLGLPLHSDYSCLTILHQDSFGLQILEDDETWKGVPVIQGALQVHVGDHLEVLSNGRYKSVVHRAILDSENTRFSIGSLHSLGMEVKMEAAKELVDEDHPSEYRGSSVREFLDFIAKNDIGDGDRFLSTIKIQQ